MSVASKCIADRAVIAARSAAVISARSAAVIAARIAAGVASRTAAAMAIVAMVVCAAPATAHKPSDSYLAIEVAAGEPAIRGRWDIALRDLEQAIGIDADGNGEISWGELRSRHREIAAYALARLAIAAGGAACAVTAGEQLVEQHSDGAYTVLAFTADCGGRAGDELRIGYSLLADVDPLHRGLLRLTAAGHTRSAVLDPAAGEQRFGLHSADTPTQLLQFGREGVWHIWIGFDHILFLVSLLLPAVLVREQGRWQPATSLRSASIDVLKIVTAFTVAHSITLSAATLGVLSLPSALVESAIAVSVVAAALNNVFPVFRGRRWLVAFGFGLVHGFGFASVLADLGLPPDSLLVALVAFNLGVEIGQLAIVAAFLPLAFALRATATYRHAVLAGGSWLIVALAVVWFVERAFGLELL